MNTPGTFYFWLERFTTNPVAKGTSTYNLFSMIFVQINQEDWDEQVCIQCFGISNLWVESTLKYAQEYYILTLYRPSIDHQPRHNNLIRIHNGIPTGLLPYN